MEQTKNQFGQIVMQKELCELLSKAFERFDWEGPSLAMDLVYPIKVKLDDGREEDATCIAIQPPRDAADIMLAVGALNSFATPPGIAEELAQFMENRVEDATRDIRRADHIKDKGDLRDIPPLLIFPKYVWNPDVDVEPPVLEKLKP